MPDVSKPNVPDPYDAITGRILELLEKGEVPWRKPWRGGWPRNLFYKRPYDILNAMVLNVAGFGSPLWASQKQIEQHKGQIKPDQVEKSLAVFYRLPPRRYLHPTGEFGRIPRVASLFRVHRVWNIEQTVGLERFIPTPVQAVPVDEARKLVEGMPKPPAIERNPGRAYERQGVKSHYSIFHAPPRPPTFSRTVCARPQCKAWHHPGHAPALHPPLRPTT